MKDFQIIGKGVTLLRTDPTKGGIEFTHCRNVTLDGITLRCDPIPYTQGRIVAMNWKARLVYFHICNGYEMDLTNLSHFTDTPMGTVFNSKTLRINKPGTSGINLTINKIVKIGPDEFRGFAPYRWSALVHVGDLIAFRSHVHYDIALINCRRMCICHVTIMAGTGFCFFEGGGGGGNRYINDSVKYPPKPLGATIPPLLASNADGLHSSCERHGPTIIGCNFEGMGDDGIAIHGSYSMLQSANGCRWIVLLPWHNIGGIHSGDQLKVYSRHGEFLGRTRVMSYKPLPRYRPKRAPITNMAFAINPHFYCRIIVNQPIHEARYADRIDDINTDGAEFIVKNCVVRNNRGRGMVIKANNGIIADNIVEHTGMCGIDVTPEFWWDESGCSCHLLIEGNTIRNVPARDWWGPGWIQAGALNITADPNPHLVRPFGHSGLIVVKNRFVDDYGINLLLCDAQDVLITGNLFLHPLQEKESVGSTLYSKKSSLVWLQQSQDVLIANNHVIHPGPALKKLVGVGPDVSNVMGIKNGVKIAAVPSALEHK
jgi:hypothetical protein